MVVKTSGKSKNQLKNHSIEQLNISIGSIKETAVSLIEFDDGI